MRCARVSAWPAFPQQEVRDDRGSCDPPVAGGRPGRAARVAAYLAGAGDDRIGSITLLNTLLDYSEPGVLGVFTDEKTVARLERQMAGVGVLDGAKMASTFDVLRANDLIFNYVVSNWLLGQRPPAFDILAWNADSTHMPAAMHSFYLRSLYINNELARGELELAGQRLSLSEIKGDAYVVGALNDHIVPWEASYQATRLLGGEVRYVLNSGGHIAGIVNPPNPKAWYEAWYEAGADSPPTGAEWRASAERRRGSWWEDWARWSAERAGPLGAPPPVGSERHPVLGEAPATTCAAEGSVAARPSLPALPRRTHPPTHPPSSPAGAIGTSGSIRSPGVRPPGPGRRGRAPRPPGRTAPRIAGGRICPAATRAAVRG
jgi:hypothetical protein